MIWARMSTKIARCLALATVLTLSADLVQVAFLGLLVAMFGGLWLRGNAESVRLPVVEPRA